MIRAYRLGINTALQCAAVAALLGGAVLASLYLRRFERIQDDLLRAEVDAAACSAELRRCIPMAELRRACTMASLSAAAEYAALRRDCEVRR